MDKITVGDFFKTYNVCIPILQRDYAQGREGKEHIREVFLKDIFEAIDSDRKITLDFVYGYKETVAGKDVFYPLDGQQRLTTIWLIYWYLAVKSESLEEERDCLRHFTYQTRKSSREFCEALCNNHIDDHGSDGLVDCIKKQNWFFASWKKDPTINAMLRMIGGTNGSDGIEPVLGGKAWKQTWEKRLSRIKNNISFYVLDIDNEKLPKETADRLYVKMNARGKALTDFENFKADFVSEIEKSAMPEVREIPKKLDNGWNDVFWRSANAGNEDGATGEVFFAFINRFCFDRLCVMKDEKAIDGDRYVLKADLINSIEEIFDDSIDPNKKKKKLESVSAEQKAWLAQYSYFSEDNTIKYTKYDYYRTLLDPKGVLSLNTVFDCVKDHIDVINGQLDEISRNVSQRENTEYHFLPIYSTKDGEKVTEKDDNGNVVGLVKATTEKERVYFFAICKYLECVAEAFVEEKFKDWLRFCRNVIENGGVESKSAMISAMRRIDGIDPQDILSYLCDDALGGFEGTTKIDKQIAEEIKKAQKAKESESWKTTIINAENTLFLCGKINFLFTDENGRENWGLLASKLDVLKRSFPENSASLAFVRRYARTFESFSDVEEKLIFHNTGWARRGDSWLDVLSEDDAERVHHILLDTADDKARNDYAAFVFSPVFDRIIEKVGVFEGKKDLRIKKNDNGYALYKKSAQNEKLCFDYESDAESIHFLRNEFLFELKQEDGFLLGDNQEIVASEPYYWGDDIFFSYYDKNYVWFSDDSIYIYDVQRGLKSKQKVSERASTSGLQAIKDELMRRAPGS